MEAYSLHLAMAALVGASFAAVFACYLHGQTMKQLLDLAKAFERKRLDAAAKEGGGEVEDQFKKNSSRRRRRKGYGRQSGGGSASKPDVTTKSGLVGEAEEKKSGPVNVDAVAFASEFE